MDVDRDPQVSPARGSAVEGDPFYRAFEDVFRGSRAAIRRRLEAYLPIVELLKQLAEHPRVMDLGCGRGEWLELLRDNGFDAVGVDLDEMMLKAARELGLTVAAGDALKALESQASSSLHLVSAFHLVEHLPFDIVRALVREARRVLAPGGLLILETPNPENLRVGAHTFYLDPTHVRPVPSGLLRFTVGYEGFSRHWLLRLNEQAGIDGSRILDVLEGVSPDYAVLGQVPADDPLMRRFDRVIEVESGRSLAQSASVYDENVRDRLAALSAEVVALRTQMDRLRRPWQFVKRIPSSVGSILPSSRALVARYGVPQLRRLLRNPWFRGVLTRTQDRFPAQFGRLKQIAVRSGLMTRHHRGDVAVAVARSHLMWIAYGVGSGGGIHDADMRSGGYERHLTTHAKSVRTSLTDAYAVKSGGGA